MSAKLLRNAEEVFYQNAYLESAKPGQTIMGIGGRELKIKETMPCEGGMFVSFENMPTMKLKRGCEIVLKGEIIL